MNDAEKTAAIEGAGWVDGKYAFALSYEVPDGTGGMTNTLTFREPTGADLRQSGEAPIVLEDLGGAPRLRIDYSLLNPMLARLASVPTSTIDRVKPNDLVRAGYALSGFFLGL